MLQLFIPPHLCLCLDFNMFLLWRCNYCLYSTKVSFQVKMGRIPELLVEVMKSVIKGLRKQKILINYSPSGFQILKVT